MSDDRGEQRPLFFPSYEIVKWCWVVGVLVCVASVHARPVRVVGLGGGDGSSTNGGQPAGQWASSLLAVRLHAALLFFF